MIDQIWRKNHRNSVFAVALSSSVRQIVDLNMQAALTELLEEKAAIERQNDLTTQEADDSRAKLERKLQLTADALHASESKVEKLQADIDHANVEIANQVAAAAVGGVSSEQVRSCLLERTHCHFLGFPRTEMYR